MGGIIGGLIIAWLLTWFGIENTIISGVAELFKIQIGIAGYYVVFAIAGFITELFTKHR
jgi:hypothetical protein